MRETLSWFETKPLFGWDVLVPRTKEQSGSTIARLEQHGANASVVPTISVEPPRTPQQLERASSPNSSNFSRMARTALTEVKPTHS